MEKEHILRQIVADDTRPEAFKAAFLAKIICNMKSKAVSPAEAPGLLKLYLDWMLNSEYPNQRNHGHEEFKSVCTRYPEYFREFVTPHLLIEVFKASAHSNREELVVFVGEILGLLRDLSREQEISEESYRNLTNIAKVNLHYYLKDHGINLGVSSAISTVYQQHPHVLPAKPEWNRFCVHVIKCLASFRAPSPPDNFVAATENVSKMLPMVWGQSESSEGIQECLKNFHAMISTEDSYSSPSSALVTIIDKIPRAFLDGATQALLDDSGQPQGEARTVLALQNMIQWLTLRPTCPIVSQWILQMLRGLQEARRNSILIEIAHSSTDRLASAMVLPKIQRSVEDIFFFLLLGFQHSESVFHTLAPKLPNMLRFINNLGQSAELLRRLAEATRFLMLRFPNFPELYNPVCKELDALKISEPSEARIKELQSLAWLSPIHSGCSSPLKEDERKVVSAVVVDESLLARSETGLVGLLNLGNTCYMNSVLQALYFTKDFCDDILSAPISGNQGALFRLQQVFAYLRFTQRAIYSPREFLKAARPPWFEEGKQQDCSEFLRYLLDTLHEQEKLNAASKARKTTETKRRDNLKPVDPDDKSPASASLAPAVSTSLMVSSTSNLKSSSTMALDVIEESPEHVVPGSESHQDEEMLSQGSGGRMDEDFFGSRTSLGVPTRDCSDEDNEAENLDFRGSKSSLGSGIKRWHTEENLSCDGGSREGKMDILDGHLHGSHSNSADSGIQSVGSRESGNGGCPQNLAQTGFHGSNSGSGNQDAEMETADASPAASSSSTPVAPNQEQPEAAAAGSAPNSSPQELESLVHTIFGGKMRTTFQCSKCKNLSEQREVFTELHLAIPDPNEAKVKVEGERSSERQALQKLEKGSDNGSRKAMNVQALLKGYLEPEILEEDNKYDCDKCGSLQDAEKAIEILSGPKYLLCTLMRFKYDRAVGRKHKIFTDIDYELELNLPLAAKDGEGTTEETYSLYAVVIHSGYSTDGGHYYTYARPPPPPAKRRKTGESEEEDTWYICNDSKVSFSTFRSFKNLTARFPRDSAYQLWYRKNEDGGGPRRPAIRRPLRADLKQSVERDNISFLREKERSSGNGGGSSASTANARRPPDPDSGTGGGGGGGGFGAPPLVF